MPTLIKKTPRELGFPDFGSLCTAANKIPFLKEITSLDVEEILANQFRMSHEQLQYKKQNGVTRWANYIHFVLVRLQRDNRWKKVGEGKAADGRIVSTYHRMTETPANYERAPSRGDRRRSRPPSTEPTAIRGTPATAEVVLAPSLTILPPSHNPTPKWARDLIQGANGRNRERGSNEKFALADLIALWEACNGVCAVSGMPFNSAFVGDGKARRPFFPSLDRIDRHRPYVRDNLRLVVSVANFAMNAWGLDPVVKLSAAISSRHASSQALTEREASSAESSDGPDTAKPGRPGRKRRGAPVGSELETVLRASGVPARETLRDAVEGLLATGPLISRQIEEELAKRFQITVGFRRLKLKSGCPIWRNQVAWALADLVRDGMIIRLRTLSADDGGTTGVYEGHSAS